MFKAILKGSVQLCLSNFDDLIKAAGAWTVLLVLLNLALQMAGFANQTTVQQMGMQNPGQFWFVMTVSILFQLVAASSIAVAWHRFALLGEPPATIHLRFGRPEWRYFLYSLLLGLFVVVLTTAIGLLTALVVALVSGFTMSQAAVGIFIILFMLGFFFTAPFLARIGLMLPAAAIDEPMGPFQALRFGKDFGWPMVFATIVLIIPFFLLDLLIVMIMGTVASRLPQLIVILQFVLLKGLEQMIVTILTLSVITIAYAFARERAEMNSQPDA